MIKVTANGPAEVLNTTTFPTDFPRHGFLFINWGPKRMLALGGFDKDKKDTDTVFKYENGSWTKMGWKLEQIQYGGGACTYNDKLAIVGGLAHDLTDPEFEPSTTIDKMVIHDLSNNGAILKKVTITGDVDTTVCHNGTVYAFTSEYKKPNKYYSYDLTKMDTDMTEITDPGIEEGALGVVHGQLSLFGGTDVKTGEAPTTYKVFNEAAGNWTDIPFEQYGTVRGGQGFYNFVVVEK